MIQLYASMAFDSWPASHTHYPAFGRVYGVWLFNDLGRAVDDVLRNNYDSITVCHYMRVATARINTFYPRLDRAGSAVRSNWTGRRGRKRVCPTISDPRAQRPRPRTEGLVAQLKQAATDYVQTYRQIFAQVKANDPAIKDSRTKTANLTLLITELTEKILRQNEKQMFIANQKARRKARDSIRPLLTAMVSSVMVFIFTYARLGQSLITPLQKSHSLNPGIAITGL